ncbi:hypothetical protein [Desertivirga brevis]|uniref:hypothetical protein n=1 Tax=Desertivirga brevis TaxID=2810310 RepID=UPI001A959D43|nr:hypothetical protein [Pedobacter sp. SYSU D00873]
MCDHLIELEKDLKDRGIIETYWGRAWSVGCWEWVYFDCQLDLESLRRKYKFESFVVDHRYDDNKSGGRSISSCTVSVSGLHTQSRTSNINTVSTTSAICGSPTKTTGGPCQRPVRIEGNCWQHR